MGKKSENFVKTAWKLSLFSHRIHMLFHIFGSVCNILNSNYKFLAVAKLLDRQRTCKCEFVTAEEVSRGHFKSPVTWKDIKFQASWCIYQGLNIIGQEKRVVIRSHNTQHIKQVKYTSWHLSTMQEPNLRRTLLRSTARIVALLVLKWHRKHNLLRPARSKFENVAF